MKVLVIGDVCKDIFIYGDCKRLCPEGPVPVFNPIEETSNMGMAGNVTRNLLALDISCDTAHNTEHITKTRYIDKVTNQLLMRVDANDHCEKIYWDEWSYKIDNLDSYDAVVISDYNKGFLEEEDIEHISNNSKLTFLDTKKKLGAWANNITFIKINEKEYNFTKDTLDTVTNIEDKLIVTKGEDGCIYKSKVYPAKHKIQTIDISGAGDTFLAGLVCRYVATHDIKQSIEFAQDCTEQVIKEKGVTVIDKKRLSF
jgi:D-glycero-beta-D-manno-heptose-7-phosphate kinase